MDATRKTVNQRINALRNQLNMTQPEFAKKLGLEGTKGRSTINNWETGNIQVKSDDLILISKTFGVSTDWLLGRESHPSLVEAIDNASKTTGLSTEAIKVLHYISNPPVDMNESTRAFNLKTLAVLNLLLGEEEKKMFNGPFGSNENTFKNVFSEMYAYIFMDDKQIKYLGHDDGSVPEFYNTKDLLREMHMAQIRRQLDYLAENKEAK